MTTTPAAESGFTLLEMTAVVMIFSLLIGVAVTIPESYITSKMLNETRKEIVTLGDAILDYYRDVEAFPATLADLVSPSTKPSGWMGPYLEGGFNDEVANKDSYKEDEYLNAYIYSSVSATVRRITSLGPNRTNDSGGGDDIVLNVDVGPVLGDLTRAELSSLNSVIATYNADFLYSNPLSTTMSTLLDELQAANYLPTGAAAKAKYRYDAWSQEYSTGGQTPVLEVFSPGAP